MSDFVRGQILSADRLNEEINQRIDRNGDTMLGPLSLSADPTDAAHAATKRYVDDKTSGVNVMRVQTVAAMKAIATVGFAADAKIICITNTYEGVEGWGGATYDWDDSIVSTATDPTAVKPDDRLAAAAGRWLLRLEGIAIRAEACGLRGDYVLPSNGSGEVLGKDNSNAMIALTTAVSAATPGTRFVGGATIAFGPGRYRFGVLWSTGSVVTFIGSTNVSNADLSAGTVFVLDGLSTSINVNGQAFFSGIRFILRGVDSNPSEASTDAFWDARVNELYGGKQWQPLHAYSVNDVCVVAGHCYKCTTAGTSNDASYGGPTGIDPAADSEMDDGVGWKFISQVVRTHDTPLQVGAIVVARHRVYVVDGAGTTSSSLTPPTSESTTPGSVTDGTVTMHFLNFASLCFRGISSFKLYECQIVGFCCAVQGVEGLSTKDLQLDCLHGLDIQSSGFTSLHEGLRMVPSYYGGGIRKRRKGVGLHFHHRVDGVHLLDATVSSWHVNVRMSNCWPYIDKLGCEGEKDTWGQTGLELNNCIHLGHVTNSYLSCVIPLRINLSNVANAPTPPPSGVSPTTIPISDTELGVPPAIDYTGFTDADHIPTHILLKSWGGKCIFTGLQINRQGRIPLRMQKEYFPASNSSYTFQDIQIEDGGPTFSNFAVVDSSFYSVSGGDENTVRFMNIFTSNTNEVIVAPGNNASIQVIGVANGGTTVAPNGVRILRLTNAGTIAGHTVTLPSVPYDGQELTVVTKSAITALTVNLPGASPDTIEGAPTTLAAAGAFTLRYVKNLLMWMRTS